MGGRATRMVLAAVWCAACCGTVMAADYIPPGAGCAPSLRAAYNWICATPPAEGTLPDRTSALVRSDPRCNGGPSLHSAGDNRANPATGAGPRGTAGRTVQCQSR
jgi:hypothetical protein